MNSLWTSKDIANMRNSGGITTRYMASTNTYSIDLELRNLNAIPPLSEITYTIYRTGLSENQHSNVVYCRSILGIEPVMLLAFKLSLSVQAISDHLVSNTNLSTIEDVCAKVQNTICQYGKKAPPAAASIFTPYLVTTGDMLKDIRSSLGNSESRKQSESNTSETGERAQENAF